MQKEICAICLAQLDHPAGSGNQMRLGQIAATYGDYFGLAPSLVTAPSSLQLAHPTPGAPVNTSAGISAHDQNVCTRSP